MNNHMRAVSERIQQRYKDLRDRLSNLIFTRGATKKMQQSYPSAWDEFIHVLAAPLYFKLLEMTGGDEEKAQDYLSDVLLITVRAMDKLRAAQSHRPPAKPVA